VKRAGFSGEEWKEKQPSISIRKSNIQRLWFPQEVMYKRVLNGDAGNIFSRIIHSPTVTETWMHLIG
jgi:hypothetical protein